MQLLFMFKDGFNAFGYWTSRLKFYMLIEFTFLVTVADVRCYSRCSTLELPTVISSVTFFQRKSSQKKYTLQYFETWRATCASYFIDHISEMLPLSCNRTLYSSHFIQLVHVYTVSNSFCSTLNVQISCIIRFRD